MVTAFFLGDVNMMNWLLLNGGDGAISDSAGDLPIHYAAIGSKPMSVLSLVDKGAFILSVPLYVHNLRMECVLIR